MDNLRRELSINARRTDTLSFGSVAGNLKAKESNIFPLNQMESEPAQALFDAIEHLMYVQERKIHALMSGVTKNTKREAAKMSLREAEKELKVAVTAVCAAMVISGIKGRRNLLNLYSELQIGLQETDIWDYINNILMKEAAQLISDVVNKHVGE